MKSKLFGLFALSVFALVFVTGLASAAFTLTPTSLSKTITNGTTSVSFDVSVNNDGAGGNYSLTWNGTTSQGSLVFPTLVTSVNNTNQSTTFSVTSIPVGFVGTITGNLIVQSSLADRTVPFTITVTSSTPSEITSCTSVGNPGSLVIKKIDFTNKGLQYNDFGEDDEWFLLDEIEAKIEIKNDGDDKVEDIEVSWGLYNTEANQWVIDLDEEDTFNIKDGDSETLTVSFKLDDDLDVDLEDLTDGDNYRFYVVASGTVDNTTAPETCVADFEQASIIIESDFVVLDNFQTPETMSCGSTVEISAEAWNIGDSDQDDVSVLITNKDLGLNEEISVGDMDAFDSQDILLSFKVPGNASEKTYGIKFQVLDEDSDVYQNDYDDDYSESTIPLTVKGGCTNSAALPVAITANLASGGKAGQDLVVKATLTNSGSNSATYVLSSSGHAEWASTYTVQPSTLTLAAGQSGEATYTFKVNADASGDQTFNIELVSGTQVTRQPVSVTIERSGLFSSITGGAISENSWVWGLGILNVVLIIVIILVAIRVARK